jgi:uroporphyrinogen decarboxylase
MGSQTVFENRFEPDINELVEIIYHHGQGKRVHFIELFLDEEIKQQICQRFGIAKDTKPDEPFAVLKREIELQKFLGYDAIRWGLRTSSVFTLPRILPSDAADKRSWAVEGAGPIQSQEDFEKYPWPDVRAIDFSGLEWLEKTLPANMGCYELTAHILEVVTFLFGYESLCFKVFDEPELVDAVCERVGNFYVDLTKALCDFPCIRFIWAADDMGFRSATLMPPEFLREKILPWHKKCAQIAHSKNRPYLLHCCGNIDAIMDDLIDDVGIDAKHSFEDTILPVTEAKKKYGDRIALLGGIDVDFLCRANEKTIRKRTRETLKVCLQGGGYCLGTGNSVANYIPLDNYLIMLDEGRKRF